ncbi:DUF4142 domain-containing protein [Sphingobacterium sp. LRF_L2]|uniref:DUF4142 domain-containing protein n=1 Tax=Sphingobacterium sp. LRF_L2 TaxID=3369421 RepID=UPI003F6292AE
MKNYLITCMIILGLIILNSSVSNAQDVASRQTMDQEFLNQIVYSNRFEIALANQALQRSNSKDIQQYGQLLMNDHTKLLRELEQAAIAKKLVLPSGLDENHAEILNALAAIADHDFDETFKRVVLKSHGDGIALLEAASAEDAVVDPELRTWATEKIPMLRSHLEHIKSIPVGNQRIPESEISPLDSI